MKTIDKINNCKSIHEIVRVIATLPVEERKEITKVINERYEGVGINESRIWINDEYVEGYSGNGFCTVNEEDYEDRFLKIYFKQNTK